MNFLKKIFPEENPEQNFWPTQYMFFISSFKCLPIDSKAQNDLYYSKQCE